MKFFALLLFLISIAVALPITSSAAGEISDDRPVLGRPISDRPVDARPVEGRPVDLRPIGSRDLEVRQNVVAGAFIISFKDGYVSIWCLFRQCLTSSIATLMRGHTDT